MKLSRNIAAAAFAVLVTTVAAQASADEPRDLGGQVRVEGAVATPGVKGGRSQIRFRIVNESRSELHLVGISTPVAGFAELVARLGPRETTKLESIGVPADEVLDLTTSHLRYEIYPLRTELTAGDEFPITLNLVQWSVTVPVHVHDTP